MFSRVQCDDNASFMGQNSYRHHHFQVSAAFRRLLRETRRAALNSTAHYQLHRSRLLVSLRDLIPLTKRNDRDREIDMGSEKKRGKVDEETTGSLQTERTTIKTLSASDDRATSDLLCFVQPFWKPVFHSGALRLKSIYNSHVEV